MQADGENRRYLPGFPLPPGLAVTSDAREALASAETCLLAIPTVYLRSGLTELAPIFPPGMSVASVAKGVEQGTLLRPTEIIRQQLGPRPVAALCGPSHAEELAKGLPASVVVASDDPALARLVQSTFTTERFRIYTNDDLLGVELCGALKNVIAIAAGVCDGLGYGDNTKAALMTRGLVEMVRFTTALGGKPETCYGLAGVGDLITTSFSPFGRNRAVGEKLGRGATLDQILAGMTAVAEGVWTARAVREQARQRGVEMPITDAVCRVLFEGQGPREAVRGLMSREMKSE
jgi:glycerol-3-phosphate dehydrogenase (NAD(P)+)